MITSVHRQGRVVDQWSGEAFDSIVRFKIPVFDGKKWKGCYATPSTALAALKAHISDNFRDKQDQQAMLEDLFQSSLRRKSESDPRWSGFIIQAAPHFTELRDFGGAVSLDAYHAKYNHDLQRILFLQEIPKLAQADDEGACVSAAAAAPGDDDGRTRKWHSRRVGIGAAATDEEDQFQTLPRCVKGWIDFLRDHATFSTGCPDAITIYFSKKDKYCFALGPPTAYFKKCNPQTSSYFDSPVYGAATVYKHTAIKLPGEEKRKKGKKDGGDGEEKDKKDEKDEKASLPTKKQKTADNDDDVELDTTDEE